MDSYQQHPAPAYETKEGYPTAHQLAYRSIYQVGDLMVNDGLQLSHRSRVEARHYPFLHNTILVFITGGEHALNPNES